MNCCRRARTEKQEQADNNIRISAHILFIFQKRKQIGSFLSLVYRCTSGKTATLLRHLHSKKLSKQTRQIFFREIRSGLLQLRDNELAQLTALFVSAARTYELSDDVLTEEEQLSINYVARNVIQLRRKRVAPERPLPPLLVSEHD